MFAISVIILCVITLILLKFCLNINYKDIKVLKTIDSNDDLNGLSSKFPKDEQICNNILTMFNKKDVKIKLESEYESCLYTIFNNTITIGKFKQNYMKIQTIAHECVHACQRKRLLWSNFIISNTYYFYFVIILMLALLNKLQYSNIHSLVLIFLSIIQYILRFSLENEAMIKARYVAEKYIEEYGILTKDEKNKLLIQYDRVNSIGVPLMNYNIISLNIIIVLIFSIISLI